MITLATSVPVLPQRQTVLTAKQAAKVDVLCGGRLRGTDAHIAALKNTSTSGRATTPKATSSSFRNDFG